MRKHFIFLDWPVYKDARDLYVFCHKLVKNLPREYRFEVGSQLLRSSLSVAANIAEGKGKNSDRELNHFFNIALGSLNETVAHVDALRETGLVDNDAFGDLLNKATAISQQLGGFKRKLAGTYQ
jgi:four helix bundle protein